MHCPTMDELVSPMPEKIGWPWTKETAPLPDGFPWPRISIVTPSFNQGEYIEEAIRSVLLQRYPNFEYIIIDGGSTDNSVEVIKKYEKWLTYWVSEPDKGQSHAINEGFAHATGQIWGYINSDDFYEPGALRTVAEAFLSRKDVHLVAGQCVVFEDGREERLFRPAWPETLDHFLLPFGSTFAQPASFWSRDVFALVEGFDPSLHYCFDREFFLKIGLNGVRPALLDQPLARYRQHRDTKTNQTIRFYEESIPMIEKYAEACGLPPADKSRLLRESRREIAYIRVFMVWKQKGRLTAIRKFAGMLLKSPSMIFQRKIAGQGRRLLCFRAENVAELKNV